MKISNELKIGIFAVIVILVSIWGYQFLRGRNIVQSANTYYVRYETIDQLPVTSSVLIRGLNVGTVTSLEFSEDMKTIIATLTIDKKIRVPVDAEALVVSTGIMGGKAVEIVFDNPCTGPDCAPSGTFLKGRVKGLLESVLGTGKDGTLSEVKTNIGEILLTVGDSLTSPEAKNAIARTFTELSELINHLANITGVLDKSMRTYDQNLTGSLKNLNELTASLASSQGNIRSLLSNLDSISADFNSQHIGEKAGSTLTEAQKTLEGLQVTLQEANTTFAGLSEVVDKANTGVGSLGKLLQDPQLYDNLNSSSRELSLLLQDLRLNPKRYVNVSVFGKKQKKYEVPENDPAYQPAESED